MTQSTISISPGLTFDALVSGERDAATPVAAARICKVAASDGQRPTYPRARWKNIAVLGNKETMEAALAWYRARGAIRSPLGPIRVPTLYNWSYDDDAVGPRPRVPSFSSWPQSFRGAGRRRPFRRRPDPGREQADAGAHRGASGLGETHAAFAISFTRSQVVACMLDRASMRASQAARL
jgi:hypothetical protein